jgi:Icc protein
MGKNLIRVAHISDLHMTDIKSESFRGSKPYENYIDVLREIHVKNCNFIIATGDMSESGSVESYNLIKQGFSEVNIPVHIIPGNHDNLDNMNSTLMDNLVTYKNNISFDNWAFYFLDTVVDGENYGYISNNSLKKFLENIRNATAKNIGVIMHHQPIDVGTPLIDRLNIKNANILSTSAFRDSRIKIILFGHVHNDYEFKLNNTVYSSAPATCFQFKKGASKLEIEYNVGYKIYTFEADTFYSNTQWLNI